MKHAQAFKEYFHADIEGSTWHLAPNTVWNVPSEVHEIHFELRHTANPFAFIKSVKGLAMDAQGRVYGTRTLSRCHEAGYVIEGRVSIGGKQYRAFTSSALFERTDGSLVNVGILYVCR